MRILVILVILSGNIALSYGAYLFKLSGVETSLLITGYSIFIGFIVFLAAIAWINLSDRRDAMKKDNAAAIDLKRVSWPEYLDRKLDK